MVTVTTVLGDLTSAQMRLLGQLALAFADGTVRITSDQNVVLRWVPEAVAADALQPARRRRPVARRRVDARRRDELPGRRVVQARGDAVARPRPAPVRQLWTSGPIWSPRCPASTSRSAAARTAAVSITSPASASRAACGRSAARPAPHYFVMVGGGVQDGITTFGRHIATVPARRAFDALERLVQLYRDEGSAAEAPLAFFRRVEAPRVKALLADLEKLTPEAATEHGFHRPGRRPCLQPGSDGWRVQRLSASTA